MKLKKSNILLIVIAIFLLISIGSVCASENITDNGDVELADDGTDVVLSDTDDNVADETDQEQINTTIQTDKDKYEFKQDSNKNFSVTVKNNKTGESVNVDKSNLTLTNENKSISFEYSNSVITITEALPVGNYNLTVNYLGYGEYINSSKVLSVKIYGNNTIETVTSVVCNGINIEIPVKIKDQVEYIELIHDNFNLTLVYTNESGNFSNLSIKDFTIENGTIKFNKPNDVELIAASLIIDYTNATEPKTVDIKVSTEIQANVSKDKFESEEIKNISIKILGAQGNLLNISKNDLKVFVDGKEITNFKYDNSNITLDAAVGVHNITIVYKGNETYNESTSQVVMKVYGNHALEVPESVVSNGTTVDIPIKLTDGVDDFTNLLNSSNTNVTIKYGTNQTAANVNWTNFKDTHKFTLTLDKIVPTTLVINYTENGKSIIKNVAIKFNTQVNIDPETVNIAEGENATFIITVIGADGKQINITKEDLTITTTGAKNKFNETTGNLTLTGLKKGIYNLTITYKGNNVNNTSKGYVLINVRGAAEINTNGTKINVNSTKKGEVQIINITNGVDALDFNKDDLNITVTYKEGNETKNITTEWNVVNGTISFTLENANFTTANLTITYNKTTSKSITLNRIYNVVIEAVNLVNEYQDGNFTFKVTDVDDSTTSLKGKKLSLLLKGNISVGHSATIDENNIASFKTANLYIFDQSGGGLNMKQLEVGNYSVEMSVSDSLKGNKTNATLTVKKANIKIEITPYKEYYGSDKNVTIKVTNVNSGLAVPGIILKLYMPQTSGQTYYVQTDSNGTARISAKNLIGGDYKLTVSNNDTKNINNASDSTTVTVMKIPVSIIAKDVTVDFNTGTTSTITVKKDGKAVSGMYLLVRVYETSKKYNDYLFQTNSKGQVSFSASLAVGKHKIVINSADNRYSASQVTKTVTVKKASAKFTAKKVTAYYKGGKYFTIKLTNTKKKKAIYDAKVNIKVYISKYRYYNYNGNTGANGQIKLSLDSLKPGSYKVVVKGADAKDYTAKQVTSKIVIKKAPTKLTPKKLTAKKGAKKYFQVKVTNKKTKKVIKGVKVKIKVYTGKKAKTYTVKTNSKGIAKISTAKLKVGSHKVIVTSANKYCVAKKAKSSIKIKK